MEERIVQEHLADLKWGGNVLNRASERKVSENRPFIDLKQNIHWRPCLLSNIPGAMCYVLSGFSHVPLSVTLWTVACQAPLSMGFSRQEYWSGLPHLSASDLLYPRIKPTSPALAGGFFTTSTTWETWRYQSVSSVAQLHPTLCDFMDCRMPGFPVHHQLPEFAQTQVHRVGDAIQPSHPLSSPSSPVFNLSQHQGLF